MLSVPAFAVDGMAVIDMRTAVLSTQAAADAFKALEEDADYASNLEEAQSPVYPFLMDGNYFNDSVTYENPTQKHSMIQ